MTFRVITPQSYYVATSVYVALLILSPISYALAESAQKKAPRMLEEVVVVAQKREQNMQDVPIAISAYSEKNLFRMNINSAMDLARIEPSLNFQQGFSDFNSNFSMRGIGSMSFEGGVQPAVSVVLDGVPLIRVGEFQGDVGDIQRVEVLKGPQGTLFGRNATGGAINVVRNRPGDEFEAVTELLATQDGEKTGKAVLSGPLTDSIGGRLLMFYRDQEGWLENVFPGAPDDGERKALAIVGKLDVDITEDLNLLLTIDRNGSKSFCCAYQASVVNNPAIRAALGEDVIRDPFKINQDSPNRTETQSTAITAEFNWTYDEDVVFTSVSSARDWQSLVNVDIDGTPASATNTMDLNLVHIRRSNFNPNSDTDPPNNFYTKYFSQELRVAYSDEKFEWISGMFYLLSKDGVENETPLLLKDSFALNAFFGVPNAVSSGLYLAFSNTFIAEVEQESMGLFSDITYSISNEWNVYAGLRWTQESGDMAYDRREVAVPAIQPFFSANDEKSTINAGAYDALDILPVDLLQLIGGTLPLDRKIEIREKTKDNDFSARIGTQYFINEDVNIYLTASRSFIGSGFNLSRDAAPENAILIPTISQALEAGLKSSLLENRMRLNASLFYQTAKDLQQSRIIPGSVFTETINAGDIESYGADLNMQFQISQEWQASLGVAYIRAEIQDLVQACYPEQTEAQGCTLDTDSNGTADSQDVSGNAPILTPEYTYNASVTYEPSFTLFSALPYATLAYVYQDDVNFTLLNDPLAVQKGYGLMDATLGLTSASGDVDVQIFGNNLLDQYYDINKNPLPDLVGRIFSQTPRGARPYYGVKIVIRM